ncbi:TonB-dependent receptor [Paraglaciecola sp.]|uniref:TonB-dependent receptor n=1 Tax=Paraglaciecola sp. TaxID=1920173 RepID=UPI003EF0FD04
MRQLPNKKKIVIACSQAIAILFSQQVFAQDALDEQKALSEQKVIADNNSANNKESEELEVIEVTGYLGSLSKAFNNKRMANGVVDSIVAEDIGKMADANVAEAMQRITGVSIDRDGGEGTTVSIRGMGPSMNQVSVNGQVVSGGSDGGAVSFDTMSADMLSSIEIVKTPSASTDEGSLGGRINLRTVRPLEKKHGSKTIRIKQNFSELADQLDPAINGNYIAKFFDDSVGVALGVTYERRRSRSDESSTYGWVGNLMPRDTERRLYMEDSSGNLYRYDDFTATMYDSEGNPSDIALSDLTETPQRGFHPKQFQSTYQLQDRARQGLNATVQFSLSDDFSFYIDASHSRLDTSRNRTSAGTTFTEGVAGVNEGAVDNGLYTGAEIDPYSETITRMESLRGGWNRNFVQDQIITETNVANIGFDYLRDDLTIEGRIGYSDTTQVYKDFNQLNFADYDTLSGYDITGNEKLPEHIYSNTDNGNRPVLAPGPEYVQIWTPPWGDEVIDGVWHITNENEHLQLANVANQQRDMDDSTLTVQLDVDYYLDSEHLSGVKFGGKYTSRAQDRYQENVQLSLGSSNSALYGLRNTIWIGMENIQQDLPFDDLFDGEGQSTSATQSALDSWAYVDFNQVNRVLLERYNNAGLSDKNGQPIPVTASIADMPWQVDMRQKYAIQQDFISAYVQLDINTLDGRLLGDIGVRYSETITESQGFGGTRVTKVECTSNIEGYTVEGCEEGFNAITSEHDYTEILPTLNLRYLLTDDSLIRFAAGKAMARPTLGDIAPYGRTNHSENNPDSSNVRVGNPYLAPMTAWQYDVAYEWYFDKSSILSAGIFYKDIDSFIYKTTERVDGTLYDNEGNELLTKNLLPEYANLPQSDIPLSPVLFYDSIKPVNGEAASILGLETNFTHAFATLPGDLSGLGVSLNYTFADSDATYIGSNEDGDMVEVKTAFQGQSKHTYNATVFWEKHGHSFRLSYNYRTESLNQANTSTADMRWTDNYGQLDLAARYKINEYLNIGLDGVNILDEKQYRFHTNAWDGNVVDETVYKNRLGQYTLNGRIFRLSINGTF